MAKWISNKSEGNNFLCSHGIDNEIINHNYILFIKIKKRNI